MNSTEQQAAKPASRDARPIALKPTSLKTATAVEMIGVNK